MKQAKLKDYIPFKGSDGETTSEIEKEEGKESTTSSLSPKEQASQEMQVIYILYLFFFCFFFVFSKILNYSPWLKIQRGLAFNLIISIHLRGGVTFFYPSCSCCVPSRPKHSVTKSCVVRRKGASSVNYV